MEPNNVLPFVITPVEDYEQRLQAYPTLSRAEKAEFLREMAHETADFVSAKDRLDNIQNIKKYVEWLPIVMTRQKQINQLVNELKAEI